MTADVDEPEDPRPALLRAPATSLLALSWIVVFLMLASARGGPIPVPALLYGGFIVPDVSHGFGDVTPLGVYGGQLWRAVTATFVHFNLVHLTLNLIGFVMLGRGVESWYGSRLFLAIYVVLGAGANLAANLLRPWIGGEETLVLHSGGGSTVVLGLIGLVAVVGWRNRSEFPRRAPYWITAILLSNAALGMIVPNIDNLGHAAGAVVGGLVGLADRPLIRLSRTRLATVAGLIALGALVGSGYAQLEHRRAEVRAADRLLRWSVAVQDLTQIDRLYHLIAARGRRPALLIPPRPPNLMQQPPLVIPEDPAVAEALGQALLVSLRRLDSRPNGLDGPPTGEAYRAVRVLVARTLFKPPNREELAAFEAELPSLTRPAWAALTSARRELERLRYPEPRLVATALSRLARRSAPPPAGASASLTAPSGRPRTPRSSGSGPGTR